MFLKDVRKLFYKDVEDDSESPVTVKSPTNSTTMNAPSGQLETKRKLVELDPQKRITSRIDANGHTTQFEYGKLNTPTRICFADGTCFDFHYTNTGALEKFTAGGTAVAMYHKSPGSGMWRVDYADGSDAEYVFENGRITHASNPSGTIELKYDNKGRIISETFQDRTVTYHRKKNGSLIGLTTPFGQVIHYKRDRKNRVCRIKDWTGQDVGIQYTDKGALGSIIYPNGTRLIQQTTPDNLPAELRLATLLDDKTIYHKHYIRDQQSRITRITNPDYETTYMYDDRGRLTGATDNRADSPDEVFTVDAMGNRQKDRHRQYQINKADRIVEANGTKFHYDGLGNLILGTCPRGQAKYAYTGINCLQFFKTNGTRAEYRYDALGRRIAKKVNGATTRYFWAGNQLLHEIQNDATAKENGNGVTDFLFFPDTPALLAIRKGEQIHWAAIGHRYEVLCMTANNGRFIWQAEYDCFGNANIIKGENLFQPFRLAGHYLDAESGLQYIQNRYYDPETGRYITPNASFLSGGSENFYLYGDGDPINNINTGKATVFNTKVIAEYGNTAVADRPTGPVRSVVTEAELKGYAIAKSAMQGSTIDTLDSDMTTDEKLPQAATTSQKPVETSTPKKIKRRSKPKQSVNIKAPVTIKAPLTSPKRMKVKHVTKKTAPTAGGQRLDNKKAPDKENPAAEIQKPRPHVTAPKPSATTKPTTNKIKAQPDSHPTKRLRELAKAPHTHMACGQIDTMSGNVVLARTDFKMAGRIPLTWTCYYKSQSTYDGLLGQGWQSPADVRLDIDDNGSVLFFNDAVAGIQFDDLPTPNGPPVTDPVYGASLTAAPEHYQVRLKSGLTFHLQKLWSQSQFHVVRILDPHNNFIAFEWEDGELRRIRNSSDQCIFVRCAEGRIVRMDQHDNALVSYHYAENRLSAAVDPLGHQNSYFYSDGHMVRRMDRNKNAFYYKYGNNDRCIRTWDDSGFHEYEFDYRPAEGSTIVTNSTGHRITYAHDKDQRLFKTEDPSGATTTHNYDGPGRLLSITDPMGNSTLYEHDESGNITGIKKADGSRIELTYDERHHPIKIKDPENNSRRLHYNDMGRLTEQISPTGERIRYNYNHWGDLTAVIDEAHTTAFSYDDNGLVTAITYGDDQPTRIQRDTSGNPTAVVDPYGLTTRYIYDRKQRLIQTLQPSGISQSFDWDPEDNLLIHTDPNGRQTRYEYGGGGKVVQRLNADGTKVAYQYDTENNLVRIRNERGQDHHYIYDPAGRIIAQTDYFGQTSRFAYNAAGQLTRCVDPLGRTVSYSHGPNGRIETLAMEAAEPIRYKWDSNDNLIAGESPEVKIQRTYDAAGRIKAETKGAFSIRYAYDKNGRLTQRATHPGNSVTFNYDAAGVVAEIRINDTVAVTIQRNGKGQITAEYFSDPLHRSFSYDLDGLLTRQTVIMGSEEIERRYSYDGAANLIAKQDSYKGDWRYDYDAMDRIVEAVDPQFQTHRIIYDPCGDLVEHLPAEKQGLRSSVYNDVRYFYDAAGNLVRRRAGEEQYDFKWDALNRLTAVKIGDKIDMAMTYDALGRLHTKTVNGETTFFYWDDHTLVCERKEDGSGLEYIYYPNTAVPLAVVDENGQVYFYHNDINGLPQELTDPNGREVWAARYDEFGRVAELLTEDMPQKLRLPGHHFDERFEMCYDGRRWFDPLTCSYLSKNPQGPSENENVYAYNTGIWSRVDTMGFCKALLKNSSQQKRHSDIKNACVLTMLCRPYASRGYAYSNERLKETGHSPWSTDSQHP